MLGVAEHRRVTPRLHCQGGVAPQTPRAFGALFRAEALLFGGCRPQTPAWQTLFAGSQGAKRRREGGAAEGGGRACPPTGGATARRPTEGREEDGGGAAPRAVGGHRKGRLRPAAAPQSKALGGKLDKRSIEKRQFFKPLQPAPDKALRHWQQEPPFRTPGKSLFRYREILGTSFMLLCFQNLDF
jgi:hypothetical protein